MQGADLLDPQIVRMPDFAPGVWLNADAPLRREELRGRVVLVDFWDYTCINCLRTLPYLRAWHARYQVHGLTIVGVHAPEFKFAAQETQVAQAARALGVPYPVLLDPEYESWTRFANRAWPTKHLVDHQGYIRYRRQGEGRYAATEEAIQRLLRQRDPGVTLPDLLPPLRAEDAPGAACYPVTPELYAGYQGGGLFGGALGNPEGYVTDGVMLYAPPKRQARREGQFFVEGFWRAWPESLAYAGDGGGRLLLPYRAAGVNAVLSPSGDPVELLLGLRPTEQEPLVEVRLDGASLTPSIAGPDVVFDAARRSFVRVTRPRLYELVRNDAYGFHELTLIFQARGLAVYAFTFNTCVAP
jgi:thiol-disulfide isomerase/thioredoxin